MKFWIVMYHHRHGSDAWPVFSDTEPNLEEQASELDDWEPDRDEWLEVFGPFKTPEDHACKSN